MNTAVAGDSEKTSQTTCRPPDFRSVELSSRKCACVDFDPLPDWHHLLHGAKVTLT